jgi:hypothetical protein
MVVCAVSYLLAWTFLFLQTGDVKVIDHGGHPIVRFKKRKKMVIYDYFYRFTAPEIIRA